MFQFEEKEFNGPLGQYLENCKPHRTEAIFNKEYKYIKEIVWDDDLNEKHGSTREGYEQFKAENPGYISYGGEVDLRTWYDHNGEVLGYLTETKKTSNDNYVILKKQFEDAKDELYRILDVKDRENFNYWLEEEVPLHTSFRLDTNNVIENICELENIITKYKEDEEFKNFLDKIKN